MILDIPRIQEILRQSKFILFFILVGIGFLYFFRTNLIRKAFKM